MHFVILPSSQSYKPISALPFSFLKNIQRAVDTNHAYFERRQQPSIFGLLIAKKNLVDDEIVSLVRQRNDRVSHTLHGSSSNRPALYRYDILAILDE